MYVSLFEHHIPMSKKLFNVLNLNKVRSLGIAAVFKKKSDNQFVYPYQGDYMEKIHGIVGFNYKYIEDETFRSEINSYQNLHESGSQF